MAGVQIGLIIIFLLFFVLTRRIFVRIMREENTNIEIHLPLLALCLTIKKKSKRDKKETEKLSVRAYIRIIAGTLKRVRKCEVLVEKIALPCKIDSFSQSTLLKPFGQQGLLYAAIAYIKSKAHKLILCDNAIISSPDITEAQYRITLKLRLFELIYALLTFRRGVYEEKRARRIRYVGE